MSDLQRESDEPPYAVGFDDEAAADLSLTGGKGANLATLVDAGFTVPPGFCITTAAYRALISDAETQRVIESLDNLAPTDVEGVSELSMTVRTRIKNADIPDPVRMDIELFLEKIDADGFAVRSSATAEDLPTASFAGQHESFLGVNGASAIFDRISDCMASLFTNRAVSYRLTNGISHAEVDMAVVVQAMVNPDAAGVLFTADPVSGNRHIASVDANYGIGDTVVAGEVSPDNARIDRRTGEVLAYQIGEKTHALHTEAKSNGTETIALSLEQRESRVLSDENLRTLVKLGDRVEALFGTPQDIEWGLVDDDFILLQSRPITSLYPLPTPLPADEHLHVYFSFGHQQAMAEALPPLVVDWFREILNDTVSPFQPATSDSSFTAEAGHRVFVDLTPILTNPTTRPKALSFLSKMSEPAVRALEALLAQENDSLPTEGRIPSLRKLSRTVIRGAPFFVSFVPMLAARILRSFVLGPVDPERVRVQCESKGHQMAERVRQPPSLATQVQTAFEAENLRSLILKIGSQSVPMLLAANIAGTMLARMYPNAADERNALGKGFDHEIATQLNQRLGDLADVARQQPAVAEALEKGASLPEVSQIEGSDRFVTSFEAFLDAFGHRTNGEIDLSRLRWKDDPTILLQTIRSNLAQSEAGEHREHLKQLKQNAEQAAVTLETRAGRGILGPVRKRVVRRLVQVYRGGIQLREHHKHGATHFLTAVHDIITEAGETLATEGQLGQPDDVWYLRKDELITALEGDQPLEVDIEERRWNHERYTAMTAPPIITSEGEIPSVTGDSDVPANALVGTPVSSGVVEGRARVVHDPSEESLEKGEILIAQTTDVGWTPLFQDAAGLVMQVGGQMTHGALVAREYGIPAVVSVSNVTTEVQTGERIRIDGGRGIVELVERFANGDSEDGPGGGADGA